MGLREAIRTRLEARLGPHVDRLRPRRDVPPSVAVAVGPSIGIEVDKVEVAVVTVVVGVRPPQVRVVAHVGEHEAESREAGEL